MTEAASTVPFGALAGLLEVNGGGPGDLLEILRGTGARLAREARAGGFVLVVDDAHLLDPASAALLLQLIRRHGVPVLAIVRAGARCHHLALEGRRSGADCAAAARRGRYG